MSAQGYRDEAEDWREFSKYTSEGVATIATTICVSDDDTKSETLDVLKEKLENLTE